MPTSLGSSIKKLRLRLPHYKKASRFAMDLGCSREYYRRIESGSSWPSKDMLEKIINALELSTEDALGLWLCWSTGKLPNNIKSQLLVLGRASAGARTAPAVLELMDELVALSAEEQNEFRQLIITNMLQEEIKWR